MLSFHQLLSCVIGRQDYALGSAAPKVIGKTDWNPTTELCEIPPTMLAYQLQASLFRSCLGNLLLTLTHFVTVRVMYVYEQAFSSNHRPIALSRLTFSHVKAPHGKILNIERNWLPMMEESRPSSLTYVIVTTPYQTHIYVTLQCAVNFPSGSWSGWVLGLTPPNGRIAVLDAFLIFPQLPRFIALHPKGN